MSHCPPPTESVLDHFPAPLEIVKTEFRELYSQLDATLACLADGIVGTPGQDGTNGTNGADGATGPPGPPGENSDPFIQAPYVTIGNVTDLTLERALTAGTGITITDAGANSTVTIATNADATVQATYVVMSLSPDLTSERVLTAGTNITITDGGANGLVTINSTGGGTPSPPERSVQFNEAGAFGGDAEFIYYTDEHSVVCGGGASSITALIFESCQVFGYNNHIADP